MDPYVGEIRLWSSPRIPNGWLPCNGQQLAISQYEVLFALLGNTYGGDAVSNFNLPNLQGVLAVGVGQGAGLSNYALAQTAGAYAVPLTGAQVPPHSHTMAVAVESQALAPKNATFAPVASTAFTAYIAANTPGITKSSFDSDFIVPSGGGQPHANVMPCLVINYIICTSGLFPSS
jgi:microcystin-dependent protein